MIDLDDSSDHNGEEDPPPVHHLNSSYHQNRFTDQLSDRLNNILFSLRDDSKEGNVSGSPITLSEIPKEDFFYRLEDYNIDKVQLQSFQQQSYERPLDKLSRLIQVREKEHIILLGEILVTRRHPLVNSDIISTLNLSA